MTEHDATAGPRRGADGGNPPSEVPGVRIRVKLIGVMVAMSLAIVVPLTTYFPARQIDELRTATHDRAKVYADLASRQLRSAVAFDDRETAREVLAAIAKDPRILGIAVYTARGQALDSEGNPSDVSRRV